ncbi:MAG: DNA polymerase/3'-5' exonuclease PolX [Minisyncoccales bacterium]
MGINKKIARLFDELALFLELEGVQWKPEAYRTAANTINNFDKDIKKIYDDEGVEGLKKINGVGENIAKHIEEYFKFKKIKKLEELRKKYSTELIELAQLEGLGPKKVKILFDELNITSKKELEKAIKNKEIRKLEGFGAVSEKNILQSLNFQKKRQDRMLLDQAKRIADEFISYLKRESNPKKIDYAGSLRRLKETIGDIDILVITDKGKQTMNAFTKYHGIKKIISKGETRSSIILEEDNIHIDLRVILEDSYPAALQYFTGSQAHNIELRKIALKKGYKLSEYGLFEKNTNKKIALKNENELYKKLGLEYIPPELRENKGELELSKKNKLPKLIKKIDVKGDLHIHTKYSEGLNTIEDMAKEAIKKGYEYIAITDHSKSRKIAGGLNEEDLKKQWREIDELNKKLKIKILKGSEVDILKNGELDYPKDILEKFDFVIGSVHTNFKMSEKEMTKRLIKALENEHLQVLGHPTGRILKKRTSYDADYKKIFNVAAKNNKLIEINSQPERLDVDSELIYEAKKQGVKFIINTDAHIKTNLNYMQFGIGQARRGYLQKNDVVNTKSYVKFKNNLNKK